MVCERIASSPPIVLWESEVERIGVGVPDVELDVAVGKMVDDFFSKTSTSSLLLCDNVEEES